MRPSLADALVLHPLLAGQVYLFPDGPFAPPPRGLLVANVPDTVWSPPAAADAEPADPLLAALMADAATCHRYPWLVREAPPASMLRWLRALAQEHRVPVAWYHLLERGDDLYYDFAFVFEGAHEHVFVHGTGLGTDEPGRVHVVDGTIDHAPAFAWVLTEVWRALGAPGGPAYFPPDDTAHFDWAKHRL